MNGGEKQKAFSMQGNGATYAAGADSIPTAPVTLVPTGVEPGQGADEGVVKMEVAETEEEKRKREKREKKERRKSEKLAAVAGGEDEVKADGEVSPKKEKVSVFFSPWSHVWAFSHGMAPVQVADTDGPCFHPEQKRSRDDDSESPKKKKSKKDKSA